VQLKMFSSSLSALHARLHNCYWRRALYLRARCRAELSSFLLAVNESNLRYYELFLGLLNLQLYLKRESEQHVCTTYRLNYSNSCLKET
jgi:hypothetical protein